jgi:hypothetical protein
LGSRLGKFLEFYLYSEKVGMLSYGTQNIPIFCVEIKFEWLLVAFRRLILQQIFDQNLFYPTGMGQK